MAVLYSLLRIHCIPPWYTVMEDALYEMASIRGSAGLSLEGAIPDHTTLMNFRHGLARHRLPRKIFNEINSGLSDASVLVKKGPLLDAVIIEAPSSTQNKPGERDLEMHQTKKGNPWHVGIKAQIGVDAKTGVTHSFTTTAVNEHDCNQAHDKEGFIFADSSYRGTKHCATGKPVGLLRTCQVMSGAEKAPSY